MTSGSVRCDEHGSQPKAYICQHLLSSMYDRRPRGIVVCDTDPEDGSTSAYCWGCQSMLEQGGGEWTDEMSDRLGVKIICAECLRKCIEINASQNA